MNEEKLLFNTNRMSGLLFRNPSLIGLYLFRKTANINAKNFSVYEAVNGVSHTYKTANIFFDLSLYHGIQAGINVGLYEAPLQGNFTLVTACLKH